MAAGGRPLTIDVRRAGAEYRLLLSGEFDLQGAATFRGALDEALWARPEHLVIDLSGLRFMDAAGLHEMVRCWDVAREFRIELTIIPAPPLVHRVFDMTRLTDLLPFEPPAEEPGAA